MTRAIGLSCPTSCSRRDVLTSFFDAHVQADGLSASDLRAMAAFGVKAALLPAHDGIGASSSEALLEHFRDLTETQARRLLRAGIRPYAALGIPPGRLPARNLAQVLDLLPHFCQAARVVAVGTIGLCEGGAQEELAFVRQIELAQSLGLPALVALPRVRRERLTRRTLELLRATGIPAERVLVSQVVPEDLPLVFGCGHLALWTPRSEQARLADVAAQVQRNGARSLILGSLAGDGASDILAVARIADRLRAAGLSAAVVRRVALTNALELFGIDRSALREEPATVRSATR